MNPKSIDLTDGCKVVFEEGWILMRKSGTEPKVRISAEAKTNEAVKKLYDKGVYLVGKSISNGE